MDTTCLDTTSSCLESVDVEMEYPAYIGLNTASPSYDHVPIGETPDSWSAVIDCAFRDYILAEGIVSNDTLCTKKTKPKLDVSLDLVVTGNRKGTYDNVLDVSESASYDRQVKRRMHDGALNVEINNADREQVVFRSSKFPTEVYETIIDYVAEISGSDRRHLGRCTRVCRAWVPRAQMCLFSIIAFNFPPQFQSLLSFQHAVRRKPFLLNYIKSFNADYHDGAPQPATLLTSYHMPSLEQCYIASLDLKRAHPSLYRFPSSASSVQVLRLYDCETGDINQLCRFLTSFRSLSTLVLSWPRYTILGGHGLPHLQFNRSKCSLQTLDIQFETHLSTVLGSLIKVHPFVAHLKYLTLAIPPFHSYHKPTVPEITDLLQHCSDSLEELTMWYSCSYTSRKVVSPLPYLHTPPETDKKLVLSQDMDRLDDLLSDESFREFCILRVRTNVAKPVDFPKLKARRVEVDFSNDRDISL
ncbi:hypothetical protein QCA50_013502 [Cerrena zonata]|uniref:F-box domain-containing protein n=1 Tax=Cerrena zonata TaxID=2478898 RepID=A0AAW0FWG6_9APHY